MCLTPPPIISYISNDYQNNLHLQLPISRLGYLLHPQVDIQLRVKYQHDIIYFLNLVTYLELCSPNFVCEISRGV